MVGTPSTRRRPRPSMRRSVISSHEETFPSSFHQVRRANTCGVGVVLTAADTTDCEPGEPRACDPATEHEHAPAQSDGAWLSPSRPGVAYLYVQHPGGLDWQLDRPALQRNPCRRRPARCPAQTRQGDGLHRGSEWRARAVCDDAGWAEQPERGVWKLSPI